MTGLRFFAALPGVLYHYVADLVPPGHLHTVLRNGDNAVTAFFVLSGFVLMYQYGPRQHLGTFRTMFSQWNVPA